MYLILPYYLKFFLCINSFIERTFHFNKKKLLLIVKLNPYIIFFNMNTKILLRHALLMLQKNAFFCIQKTIISELLYG